MRSAECSLLPEMNAQVSNELTIEEVVNNYAGLVYNCSYRILNDHQLAEDVSQATFVLFNQKFKTLPKGTKIGGWFHRTATFISKDVLKKEMRRNKRESESMKISNGNQPNWNELSPIIDETIQLLPGNQKEAVRLKYLEGKSQEEISLILGAERGTVSSWISRGLDKLRKKLQSRGVVVSVTVLMSLLTKNLSAHTHENIQSLILKSIVSPGGRIQVLTDSFEASQKFLKLKILSLTGLLGLAAILGFFISIDKANPSPFENNALSKIPARKVVHADTQESIYRQSLKSQIPKITPLVIGESSLSFPGEIIDLKYSESGDEIAVAVSKKHDESVICLVDVFTQAITREIPLNGTLYKILYAGQNKLVCRFEGKDYKSDSPWKIHAYRVISIDLESGKTVQDIWVPGQTRNSLSISPDGRKVYVGGNYDLIKLENGELGVDKEKILEEKLANFDKKVNQLKTVFSSGDSKNIELVKEQFSRKTGTKVEKFEDLKPYIDKERTELKGKSIKRAEQDLQYKVLSKDDDILVFELESGELLKAFENVTRSKANNEYEVDAIGFSNDTSKMLIVDSWSGSKGNSMDRSGQVVREYDVNSGMLVREISLKGASDLIRAKDREEIFQLNENEYLVSQHVVNFEKGKVTKTFKGKGRSNKRNTKFYNLNGKKLDIYSLPNFELIQTIDLPNTYNQLTLNLDESELLLWKYGSSRYNRLKLATGEIIKESTQGHSSIPGSVNFISSGRLLVHESNCFHVYDVNTGEEITRYPQGFYLNGARVKVLGHGANVLFGGTGNGKLNLVSLEDGSLLKSYGQGKGAVSQFYLNESAGLVALKKEYRKEVEIYDLHTGEKLSSFDWLDYKGNVYLTDIVFSNNGTRMYVGDNCWESARHSGIWDPQTGQKLTPFILKDGTEAVGISSMIFNSKKDKVFLSTFNKETRISHSGIWDTQSGKCLIEINRQSVANIQIQALSDDGKFLISKQGTYDIDAEEMVWKWDPQGEKVVNSVSVFSKDKLSLLRVSKNKISIYDSLSGELLQVYEINYPGFEKLNVSWVVWDNETGKLALTHKGTSVYIFDLNL